MTGNPSVTSSIEALRAGAWDYLPKPFSRHAPAGADRPRVARGDDVARGAGPAACSSMKQHGHSDKIALHRHLARCSARRWSSRARWRATDASVFISGESGTGKEVIAQFIHQHSRRASRTLVPINCAALPEPLLESEMFGHRKGAFTGADRDKPGLLETANGGTLFLDELTEMSHAAPGQAAARASRTAWCGGSAASSRTRWWTCASSRPPTAIRRRRWTRACCASDLFYRLRVVPIKLPPLRKRLEDIPLLANHFLDALLAAPPPDGRPRCPRLSEASIAFLRSRPWRGNVRELQNVIEHVAVLAEPDQVIQPNDIPVYDDAADVAGRQRGTLPA